MHQYGEENEAKQVELQTTNGEIKVHTGQLKRILIMMESVLMG
jgi:hypothetical protein